MSPGILILMLVALALALAAALVVPGLLAGRDPVRERIQTYTVLPDAGVAVPARRRSAARFTRLRLRLNAMLSALASEILSLQLARANWHMTVQEYLLIRLGVTILCFLLAWLISRSVLSGIGLALIAYMIPGIILRRSITQRQTQFGKQLGDVLSLINGAVRAGHSLLQALEVVVREMKPPASEEFGRVVREVGLGLRLTDALRNLSARMQNGDLDLVVTSIDIQYQVGGNMATMLEAVTETLRDRMRLFGEIRVLTTQQRYSSYLISVLPIFVGGMLFIINPEYMGRLFEPGPILCIPIGAVIGILLGHVVIQRIIRIDV